MLIGEVARRSSVSARMLRHYDRIGLVRPGGRTAGGYRRYTDDDLGRLFQVEALRSLGLTLAEIAGVLGDGGVDSTDVVRELIARSRERLAREQELLRRLELVAAGAPADWSDVLSTTALMRGLSSPEPSLRQRWALAAAGSGAAVLATAALAEDDVNVAGALHWALARTGEAALPTLAAALDSRRADERHRASAALEKLRTAAADEVLAARVGDPDAVVAARAVLAAGRGGRADVIPVLVGMVADGDRDVEAGEVLAALARAEGAAVGAAIAAALTTADVAGRRRLVDVLGDLPRSVADDILRSLLSDEERPIVLTARYLLDRE